MRNPPAITKPMNKKIRGHTITICRTCAARVRVLIYWYGIPYGIRQLHSIHKYKIKPTESEQVIEHRSHRAAHRVHKCAPITENLNKNKIKKKCDKNIFTLIKWLWRCVFVCSMWMRWLNCFVRISMRGSWLIYYLLLLFRRKCNNSIFQYKVRSVHSPLFNS